MKPTSVIFLILSVILIAGGAVTCITAQKLAESNDINLFFQETDENLNSIQTYEFSELNTNKITLKLKDVNVNIRGNAEKSYIQLTNFSKNMYDFSISNKNMSLNDSINLFSLFQITTEGINFNGLRHYIFFDRFKNKQKSVDVYISKSDKIKIIEIEVLRGDITISDIPNQADYILSALEGNIYLNNIKIISTITADINKGDYNIETMSISGDMNIKVNTGNINAVIMNNKYRGYHLAAKKGHIDFFGESKKEYFDLEPLEERSVFSAETVEGNITLKLNPNIESNAATFN